MKLKKLTAALFILLIGATKAWAANDCQEPFYNKFIHKTFFYGKIDKSGIFCLNRDLYAPKVYRWLEGAEEDLGSPLLLIKSSHVALDLQGHEINEQWKGAGSAVLAYGDDQNGSPNSDVSIRNGVIINRTGSGFISSRWGYDADWPLLYKYAGYSEDKRSKKFPDPMAKYFTKEDFEIGQKNKPSILTHSKITWPINRNDLSHFPATKHRLENLRIEANGNEKDEPFWNQDLQGSQGIVIRGAQNIIRNCTIEVTHADAGIYLFGPNQVIENNTIIFKGHLPQGMSAPIRLSLADGSIIRNNTIIVQSEGANKPAAAISLIDSRNVIIENNTIEGVEAIYKSWDELPEQKTSVQEKDNRFKKGWKLF